MTSTSRGESRKQDPAVIAVVGCGLAGCMSALLFARRGFNVEIFESGEDWRKTKPQGVDDLHRSNIKRSINLALSHRGRSALRKVGVEQKILKHAIPMRCRAIHTEKDSKSPDADSFQPYDENDPSNCIYSISRELLNNFLLQLLEANPKVKVRFQHKLMHIDRKGVAHFDNKSSGESVNTYNDYSKGSYQLKARLIVGADGAYSAVRESMLRLQETNFERSYITHGYKELTIPPQSGKFALKDHEALHIWPRGDFMMIALPNPDKTFTCTIFAPFHTENGVQGLKDINSPEEIQAYMKAHFPDAVRVMPDYCKSKSPHGTTRITSSLVGDAAHAMVPFYGQGMNAAFEDCLLLDEILEANSLDISSTVPEFVKKREPAGRAIAKLSMGNYLEMRHHTGSRLFLLRKKLEGVLNYLFPDWWIPLYKMVTFTRIPYDDVIAREAEQDKILTRTSYAAATSLAAGAAYMIRSAL
eukprot:jgi/Bigna1/82709/fgenesh1_pg.96_\